MQVKMDQQIRSFVEVEECKSHCHRQPIASSAKAQQASFHKLRFTAPEGTFRPFELQLACQPQLKWRRHVPHRISDPPTPVLPDHSLYVPLLPIHPYVILQKVELLQPIIVNTNSILGRSHPNAWHIPRALVAAPFIISSPSSLYRSASSITPSTSTSRLSPLLSLMSSDEPINHLAESGITMHSDSEQYSGGDELSSPPSSNSPVILYKPPTAWSLVRGAAINLLLPFINGMMLGFGELFAHEAAFRLGWGGTKVGLSNSSRSSYVAMIATETLDIYIDARLRLMLIYYRFSPFQDGQHTPLAPESKSENDPVSLGHRWTTLQASSRAPRSILKVVLLSRVKPRASGQPYITSATKYHLHLIEYLYLYRPRNCVWSER